MWENVVRARTEFWKGDGAAQRQAQRVGHRLIPKRGCSLGTWRISRADSNRGDVFVTLRVSANAPHAAFMANAEQVAFVVDPQNRKLAVIPANGLGADVYTVRPAQKKSQMEVSCVRAVTQMLLRVARGTFELPVPTVEDGKLVFDLSGVPVEDVA